MSENQLRHTHTPGVRSQMTDATDIQGNSHLRKSPVTWNKKRSMGTTQTTHHRLLSKSSTALPNKEASTQMNMRAWKWILAPLICQTKKCATQNQIESQAKNIIIVIKNGTGMRNPFSTVQRWAAIEVWKGKKTVWRIPHRKHQNRTRNPPHINVRWKKRRKKRKVSL